MAASASSRLLSFSNNATLGNLIRHHLRRPAICASQPLNRIAEPHFSDQKSSGCVAEILERKTNRYGYSFSIMGSSGVDHQPWILNIQSEADELYFDSSDNSTTPDKNSGRHYPEIDGIRPNNRRIHWEEVEDYDDSDHIDEEDDSDYDDEDCFDEEDDIDK